MLSENRCTEFGPESVCQAGQLSPGNQINHDKSIPNDKGGKICRGVADMIYKAVPGVTINKSKELIVKKQMVFVVDDEPMLRQIMAALHHRQS